MSVRGRGAEASGSGSRLADPVGTLSRAGIRSREAPQPARLFEQAEGRAGLAVGRPPASTTTSTAPDCQTARDSRPPNAALILVVRLSRLEPGAVDLEQVTQCGAPGRRDEQRPAVADAPDPAVGEEAAEDLGAGAAGEMRAALGPVDAHAHHRPPCDGAGRLTSMPRVPSQSPPASVRAKPLSRSSSPLRVIASVTATPRRPARWS